MQLRLFNRLFFNVSVNSEKLLKKFEFCRSSLTPELHCLYSTGNQF